MSDRADFPIHVQIIAEADAEDLIADITYRGDQFASVLKIDGEWQFAIYDKDSDSERRIPFRAFVKSLTDVAGRLT